MTMPDCAKYTLEVEAFRVTREDYAEDDVPVWAWEAVENAQDDPAWHGEYLGKWLVNCPSPIVQDVVWVSDADFRANFRRVEVQPEGDSDYMLGWKTAMNGWEKPVSCRCAGQTEDGYANYLRGFADGRAELEARR